MLLVCSQVWSGGQKCELVFFRRLLLARLPNAESGRGSYPLSAFCLWSLVTGDLSI